MTEEIETQPAIAERVLIVEDDPATRTGLAELVQAWGFHTEEASDGEEAMRKVTTFRPAIIVSDLVMPRMGGLELLRALQDQLTDLTVILLTAQGTIESAVERDQRRRVRLLEQAGRSATAPDPAPEGGRASGNAARGADTPAAVA